MKKFLIGSALAAICLAAGPALASSHREAPNITALPKVDNTDVYAFRSYEPGRDGFVTIIANFQPDQSPGSGPNYFTMDPDAVYEIHIDNVGDAKEHLTYQFKFTNSLQMVRASRLTWVPEQPDCAASDWAGHCKRFAQSQ